MSDPATNPAHDLLSQPQDTLRAPSVRLGTFLSWLRILAGRRGYAQAEWRGAGFTYVVAVRRTTGPEGVVIADDPQALERDEVRQRLRDALA